MREPHALRRFMMGLPEVDILSVQWQSTVHHSGETWLMIASLVECIESLKVILPPLENVNDKWTSDHCRKLRECHHDRKLDLEWIHGKSSRYGLTFAVIAQAIHLVLGWDEDVLRKRCLKLVNTEPPQRKKGKVKHLWHQALYGGNAGRLSLGAAS